MTKDEWKPLIPIGESTGSDAVYKWLYKYTREGNTVTMLMKLDREQLSISDAEILQFETMYEAALNSVNYPEGVERKNMAMAFALSDFLERRNAKTDKE